MAGKITNEFLDEFPATTRPGAGNRTRKDTDADIALRQLVDHFEQTGTPSPVLKFVDYTTETVTDEAGNEVEQPVDEKLARQRASGRIAPLKKRGYSIEDGWVLASRNGALYAKYFGPGNVPDEYVRKEKAGSDVEEPVGERVPMPV